MLVPLVAHVLKHLNIGVVVGITSGERRIALAVLHNEAQAKEEDYDGLGGA